MSTVARWAKPVIPIGVEGAGKVVRYQGITYDVPTYILSEEDVERVRLGYVCIICLEQHEQNHPKFCGICGFPISAIQDDVFETLYLGEVKVGPSTSIAEEFEIAQELVERERSE